MNENQKNEGSPLPLLLQPVPIPVPRTPDPGRQAGPPAGRVQELERFTKAWSLRAAELNGAIFARIFPAAGSCIPRGRSAALAAILDRAIAPGESPEQLARRLADALAVRTARIAAADLATLDAGRAERRLSCLIDSGGLAALAERRPGEALDVAELRCALAKARAGRRSGAREGVEAAAGGAAIVPVRPLRPPSAP